MEVKEDFTAKGRYRAALILHDSFDKSTRSKWIDLFKDGKIDLLIVFQMLQTGFDAPRLKKLYLHRMVKEHNLLQTAYTCQSSVQGYEIRACSRLCQYRGRIQ